VTGVRYSLYSSVLIDLLIRVHLSIARILTDSRSLGGTHSTIKAVTAGLDMEMPGDTPNVTFAITNYWNGTLDKFYANGTLPSTRLNDMLLRILTPYFHLGQNKAYPSVDPSSADLNGLYPKNYRYDFNLTGTRNRDVRGNHARLIRALGAQSAVLLKNVNGALPLKAPKNIGVFGNDAADSVTGQYSFQEEDIGTLPIGGGSGMFSVDTFCLQCWNTDFISSVGAARFTYIVSPLEAIKARGRQDGALVQYITNNTLAAKSISTIYPVPEVCLVFLKTYVAEGVDRISYDVDANGNSVVSTVAATCNNTIVITHSGGINIMPWADNENVTAIVAAHFPGQELGNSIVDVLYGAVNPSGHLPYTIAYNASDYNTAVANFSGTKDPNGWQSNYNEGLLIDYRYFDHADLSPRYEFGFGLSYTTFSLSNLKVIPLSTNISPLPAKVSGPNPPGGNPDLYIPLVSATVTLTNTGAVAGAAVPQLYISPPQSGVPSGTPPQALRGFEKVYLRPSKSASVSFEITRRDVSYWDVAAQQWRVPEGEIGVRVGFSSRDQPVKASVTLL
jgi:beta-glucosidase